MPRCEECQKDFATDEGLKQHNQDKHQQMSRHELRKVKKQERLQQEDEQKRKASRSKNIKLITAVVGVSFVLALIVYAALFLFPAPDYTPLTEDGDHTLGLADAPVTITEYSDFQCPFCARFAMETKPELVEEYIDTGKVKLIYKHFPLPSHLNAPKAAEASECAAEQGKFWEYHDLVFKNQVAIHGGALKDYASQLGLDRESFDACLDSGVMAERVRADLEEGQFKTVRSTPTLFVNGIRVEGAQPLDALRQYIDSELPVE